MGNNLQIVNTGLDHCYINGLPIVEAEFDMADIYKKVARISSLAVNADSFFSKHTKAQKILSELHGEGDRITKDFLEEGAKELLPIFTPFQRWIPEGAFDTTPFELKETGLDDVYVWNNPNIPNLIIESIEVICKKGTGTVETYVNDNIVKTRDLPDTNYISTSDTRALNPVEKVEIIIDNNNGFEYELNIYGYEFNAIGWIKALSLAEDVKLPARREDIVISSLVKDFSWVNTRNHNVIGCTIQRNYGGSDIIRVRNSADLPIVFMDGDNPISGMELLEYSYSNQVTDLGVRLDNPTEDFNYDFIISVASQLVIPSPRFEFDSSWNPGKIIFRYQNMDTRGADQKLNYTSDTLKNVRIDPNTFENVQKYLGDSLKNYVLKELYETIGHVRKANEYFRKYEQSRAQAKFWVRSEKGLQTQYF